MTLDTTELRRLIAERDELDRKIEEMRRSLRRETLAECRNAIVAYGFTVDELFKAPKQRAAAAPAKYRNPATGETWTGRGKAPRWYTIAEDKAALEVGPHNPLNPTA